MITSPSRNKHHLTIVKVLGLGLSKIILTPRGISATQRPAVAITETIVLPFNTPSISIAISPSAIDCKIPNTLAR